MRRALAALGLVVLGVLALAGLSLSAVYLTLSTELGRSLLVPRLLAVVNGQIAGRVELDGFEATGSGGLALRGLRILDPRGQPVLELRRAQGQVDLSRLRSRRISVRLSAEGLVLRLSREPGEPWNLVEAVALRTQRPPGPPEPLAWTLRLARLDVADGAVSVKDGASPEVRIAGLRLAARALLSPRGGRGELSLRGALQAPVERPFWLELAASQAGEHLSVPHLRAALGETVLDAAADGAPAAHTGRLAILAARLQPEEALLVDARARLEPLAASGYAEADGKLATGAFSLRPAAGGGKGDAGVALRLPPAERALGLDLTLDRLDPAAVSPLLPPGELRVTATGHAAGADMEKLRAALVLRAEPSRLRSGRFGPLALQGQARDGRYSVSRLDAVLPGATLAARGSWVPLGPVSGSLVTSARDLSTFARNLSALTGAKLPRFGGSGRIEGSLAGTARDPRAKVRLQSPRFQVEEAVASGASLEAEVSGPAGARQARLDATVARLSAPGLEARSLTARARLAGQAAEGQLSMLLPDVGPEPFALRGGGTFSDDQVRFTLAALSLAWPGTRFDLAAPARFELDGPRVDRLELRSGPQRLAVEGGLTGGVLDAAASAEALDLSRLPSRLLPEGLDIAGTLSFRVTATGKPAAPLVTAHAELAGGAARGLSGVGAVADARVDLPARRAAGTLAVRGLAGGSADLAADLPLEPRRARAAEPLQLTAALEGIDVAALLRAAGAPEGPRGKLSGKATAGGTAGAPTFSAALSLADGAWQAYGPLGIQVSAGERSSRTAWTLAVDHAGARALTAEGTVGLDLAALLRDPSRAAAALQRAPLEARARVPGVALASLAGRGHLPAGLTGRLEAALELRGSARAPRGTLTAEVTELSHRGYAGLGGTLLARAEEGATSVRFAASGSGQPLFAGDLRLGLAAERLGDEKALRAAPVSGTVDLEAADLARLQAPAPFAGSARLRARLGGTVGAPEIDGQGGAERLVILGRPVGEVTASVRAAGGVLAAEARVAATLGGKGEARLDVPRGFTLEALERGTWREAPAKARLRAEALDLGILASAAPGTFRSAAGRLDAALEAEGTLASLRPDGTLRVTGGRVNVVGGGEWHAIELSAAFTADAVRVERLAAERGRGSVQGSGAVTGLAADGPAKLEAHLTTQRLLISRAGQDLATLDMVATLTGTASASELVAELTIPEGTAHLPVRPPRQLQSLEPRPDVRVGKQRPAEAGPAADFRAEVHLIVPGRFKVKSTMPAIDMTLRGDTTFTYEEGELTASGRMEVMEGTIEAYGRRFKLRRAVVVFDDGPPADGALDAEALWTENPAARVKIAVTGVVSAPDVKMTSEPPLDEGTIALLIATGRTEPRAGAGGVSSITGEEAGSALLGALATKALREVLQDKLPVDVVPVSATQIRAGVYVLDGKVYIGYVRRLDANPEQGQNANEGRVEWQLSPRWSLETRYGDAGTGSASVVWSKEY
ncbi:MAG: translocation/assembly module TamB domain-containing protein [Deltaproteobacteria bacterium]|nr:translocation/assembly module TamB domain-containing protein [Deltaproteobacteria bacterium]